MDPFKSFFSFLKDYFAVIVSALIGIGILNVYYYYLFTYNFDVLPYISTSEIIGLAFLSLAKHTIISVILENIIILILIVFCISFISVVTGSKYFKIDFERNRITMFPTFIFLLMWIPATAIIDIQSRLFDWNIVFFNTKFYFDSSVFLITISIIFGLYSYRNDPISKTYTLSKVFFNYLKLQVLYILLLTISETKKEGFGVISKYKYFGTVVVTDKTEFRSDSINTYIGRTASAIFLYSRISHVVTVIPASEIKNLKISNKF